MIFYTVDCSFPKKKSQIKRIKRSQGHSILNDVIVFWIRAVTVASFVRPDVEDIHPMTIYEHLPTRQDPLL